MVDAELMPVEWRVADAPVPYADALAAMDARVDAIVAGTAPEQVWLLEHPALYTAGTSARAQDLLTPDRFPVHWTGRGGQFTYHGPGQRVAYTMLDLRRRGRDVRALVAGLEAWVIATLAAFNVKGEVRPGRVGVWVDTPAGEKKIAAIGLRVRHWVSFHGISVNVEPDLNHYAGIVPCGLGGYGVTSLVDQGLPVTLADVDAELRRTFAEVFGKPDS